MRKPFIAISLAVLSAAAGPGDALADTQADTQPDTQTPPQQLPAPLRTAMIDTSAAAFRKLDADGDGRISALEANVDPKIAERFLQADKNQDGFLSLAEFRSLNVDPDMSVIQPSAHE